MALLCESREVPICRLWGTHGDDFSRGLHVGQEMVDG